MKNFLENILFIIIVILAFVCIGLPLFTWILVTFAVFTIPVFIILIAALTITGIIKLFDL